jgi:hypothetical protein
MLSDLARMNTDEAITGGIPLERWLRNAAYATSTRPEKQRFFRELADKAAKFAVPPADLAPADGMQEERILFVADLLPFGFLSSAARTGKSIARMIVPRFEGGEPCNHPTSSDPMLSYGTGWLIGPKHIITNHHVVNARSDGELPAEPEDFKSQACNLEIQFDFDSDSDPGLKFKSIALKASDSKLDYIILELDGEPGRLPLPLWGRAIDFTEGARLPVNIIQHPGGQPKQMAIRNNLAATLQGSDLAYYTDTKAGSSGSPVCNDRWQVLALHRASTISMGKFTYQGKETAWVNVGTTMQAVVADLQAKHSELWESIRPVVV